MSLLSALKYFFAPLPEGAVRYKGFTIMATPEQVGNHYRISGNISKKDKQHSFSLVDRVAAEEVCVQRAHEKAKIFIDQKGEAIFS